MLNLDLTLLFIVSCVYFAFTEVLEHGVYFSTLIYQYIVNENRCINIQKYKKVIYFPNVKKTIFLNSKKPVGQTVLGVFMQVKIGLKKTIIYYNYKLYYVKCKFLLNERRLFNEKILIYKGVLSKRNYPGFILVLV